MNASDHSLLPRQTAQVNGQLAITDRVYTVRWVYAGRVDKQVSYRDFAATDFELQSAGDFPWAITASRSFSTGRPPAHANFAWRSHAQPGQKVRGDLRGGSALGDRRRGPLMN